MLDYSSDYFFIIPLFIVDSRAFEWDFMRSLESGYRLTNNKQIKWIQEKEKVVGSLVSEWFYVI